MSVYLNHYKIRSRQIEQVQHSSVHNAIETMVARRRILSPAVEDHQQEKSYILATHIPEFSRKKCTLALNFSYSNAYLFDYYVSSSAITKPYSALACIALAAWHSFIFICYVTERPLLYMIKE